jgi:hypothetical protein
MILFTKQVDSEYMRFMGVSLTLSLSLSLWGSIVAIFRINLYLFWS